MEDHGVQKSQVGSTTGDALRHLAAAVERLLPEVG